jgi:short-subunit dehydrogenase
MIPAGGARQADRIAVVTGASSGIGRSIARALALEGWTVVLSARDAAALEKIAGDIRTTGREAHVIAADLTSPDGAERLIDDTLARLGRIDLLVASAGIYVRKRPWEATAEEYRASMELNFYGAVRPIIRVLPHMMQRGSGQIVGISSVDGKKGLTFDVLYVPTKFALTGFLDVLRQEVRDAGIAVTTVLPGRVDTPMLDTVRVPMVSAKISSEVVARAVLRGVRRRSAEVLVPYWSSKAIILLSTFSARLGDWLVRIFKLEGSSTTT